MKVFFIDNFDSFTYNLVDEFEKRNCEVMVYRNNIDMNKIEKEIEKFKPKLIVISPGPCSPNEAGNSIAVIQKYHKKISIFGVCLGLQCIVEAFEGKVGRSVEIKHGKPSLIKHDGIGIFKGLPKTFQAGRYHSLEAIDVPYCLEISARSVEKNIVMAVRHKEGNTVGIQFHPESILTPIGGEIIENVINEAKK